MATLFTSKDPVVRLIVLIYFKLGKAEGVTAMISLSLHGEGRRGSAFFYVDFFFFFSTLFSLFPSAPFWALGVSVISPFGPLDFLCLLILTCK